MGHARPTGLISGESHCPVRVPVGSGRRFLRVGVTRTTAIGTMEQFVEFVGNHTVLFALLGLVLAMVVWTEFRRFTSEFKDISPQEAVRMINHENALMLDVREDAERVQGSIQNSKHIPLSTLKQRVGELAKYSDRPVVTYCRTGSRSRGAGNILLKNHFKNVSNLRGGIAAWDNANLPKVAK
jgi:rhodanese-related sulfurtransferase